MAQQPDVVPDPAEMPGQYRVTQWMGETALMYRGFAWQQEFHRNRVTDTPTGIATTLLGLYAQVGYFPHEAVPAVPASLELAAGMSLLNANTATADDLEREASLSANWFFAGHRNELTAEVSRFSFVESAGGSSGWRGRVQWDISL